MLSPTEAQLKEQKAFEYYKKTNPAALSPISFSEKEIFSRIGINISFSHRYDGYIRFYPQDFIVEEVSINKKISEIEPKENIISSPEHFHLYCDLIKVGISTFDALNFLAENLEIKPKRIAYAGLKDDNAVTSQRFVFLDCNPALFEKIKKISSTDIFLSNFSIGQKNIWRGELFGNRFTIFVRTQEKVDEKIFSQKIEKIQNEGFLNFYQTQRFGYPRFLSHTLGKLILQGRYKETVFYFFTSSGLQEIGLIKEKRREAGNFFEDWEKMEEIFSELPFTFRKELELLSYLKKEPKDFISALIFFQDQTKFWVYAYASYLFNQILSLKGVNLPEEIPLLLSDDFRDQKIYKFKLGKDEIQNFQRNLKPFFRFLKLQRRFVKSRVLPQKVLFKIVPEGVVLSFALQKGVYATTFLMNFFEIQEGLPLPEWVKTQKYDTKKLLGIGSIEAVKNIFGEKISSPMVLY